MRLALVGFATGLSFTNHGVSVFMLPATVAFVASRRFPGIARPRALAAAAGGVVVGLLPWIYVVRGLFVPMPRGHPDHHVRCSASRTCWRLVFDQPLTLVGDVGTITKPVDTGGVTFLDNWHLLANDMLRELGWGWLALALAGWVGAGAAARARAGRLDRLDGPDHDLVHPGLASHLRQRAVLRGRSMCCWRMCVAVGGRGGCCKWVAPVVKRFAPAYLRYAAVAAGLAVVIAAGLRVQQQLTGPARSQCGGAA